MCQDACREKNEQCWTCYMTTLNEHHKSSLEQANGTMQTCFIVIEHLLAIILGSEGHRNTTCVAHSPRKKFFAIEPLSRLHACCFSLQLVHKNGCPHTACTQNIV